jgi:hypothetical protein
MKLDIGETARARYGTAMITRVRGVQGRDAADRHTKQDKNCRLLASDWKHRRTVLVTSLTKSCYKLEKKCVFL